MAVPELITNKPCKPQVCRLACQKKVKSLPTGIITRAFAPRGGPEIALIASVLCYHRSMRHRLHVLWDFLSPC